MKPYRNKGRRGALRGCHLRAGVDTYRGYETAPSLRSVLPSGQTINDYVPRSDPPSPDWRNHKKKRKAKIKRKQWWQKMLGN